MSEATDYEAVADEIRAEVLMLSQGVPSSTATYDLLRRTGDALRQAAQDRVVVEAATNFVMASDVGDPEQIASCAGYLEQVVKARIEDRSHEIRLTKVKAKLDAVKEWATEWNPPDYGGMDEDPVASGPGDKVRGYNIARRHVAALLARIEEETDE